MGLYLHMETNFLKNLFQQEFSKMVAVISKIYGLQHLEIAEDIVSDTFMQAVETWGVKGTPENPVAWLYTVAKQKTLYHFRRNKIYEEKIMPMVSSGEVITEEIDFSEETIKDSQLQMIFAICNPVIASEAQIALALRILCGFGIDEIAEAFFSNKETINKRLHRAKEKLRNESIKMELPNENEIQDRLDNALHIIYLLFNEGYYSKTQNHTLQNDLCLEALRLGLLLTQSKKTNIPKTNALVALMCFHASRFKARQNSNNTHILYENQDYSLWSKELIRQGMIHLGFASKGNQISSYHLEASIAYWHCQKEDSPEKWKEILSLYDKLVIINFSPNAALNRMYAFYKVHGKTAALKEIKEQQFIENHFFYTLLGELYLGVDNSKAQESWETALSMASTETDKQLLKKKIDLLN